MLRDMRRYGGYVVAIAANRRRGDLGEPMTRLAPERAVEVIGEAASRLSPEFLNAHPEIPWRQIIALRNVLAHQYATIDLDTLWLIATERVPELLRALEPMVPEADDQQAQ